MSNLQSALQVFFSLLSESPVFGKGLPFFFFNKKTTVCVVLGDGADELQHQLLPLRVVFEQLQRKASCGVQTEGGFLPGEKFLSVGLPPEHQQHQE